MLLERLGSPFFVSGKLLSTYFKKNTVVFGQIYDVTVQQQSTFFIIKPDKSDDIKGLTATLWPIRQVWEVGGTLE